MADLGNSVQIKYIPSLAFSIACRKVISLEDIKEAQRKRAKKDATKSKGKCG
jgi:hypothetical protein